MLQLAVRTIFYDNTKHIQHTSILQFLFIESSYIDIASYNNPSYIVFQFFDLPYSGCDTTVVLRTRSRIDILDVVMAIGELQTANELISKIQSHASSCSPSWIVVCLRLLL
jgi:hypothetical protein